MSRKYRNGTCFFAYGPAEPPVKPGRGKPSAYVFQLRCARSSVSPRFLAETMQVVQSEVIPCVEPDTSAR